MRSPQSIGLRSPAKTPPRGGHHQHGAARFCNRKTVFVWSFVVFTLSIIVVNVSFASAYQSVQGLGSLVYSTVKSQRTVLQFNAKRAVEEDIDSVIELTSVDRSDAEQAPNATDASGGGDPSRRRHTRGSVSGSLGAAGSQGESGLAATAAAAGGVGGDGAREQRAAAEEAITQKQAAQRAIEDEQRRAKAQADAAAADAAAKHARAQQQAVDASTRRHNKAAVALAANPPPTQPSAGANARAPPAAGAVQKRQRTGKTLVVYVFQNADLDNRQNFDYFLANGLVDVGGDNDYVLLLQQLGAVRALE